MVACRQSGGIQGECVRRSVACTARKLSATGSTTNKPTAPSPGRRTRCTGPIQHVGSVALPARRTMKRVAPDAHRIMLCYAKQQPAVKDAICTCLPQANRPRATGAHKLRGHQAWSFRRPSRKLLNLQSFSQCFPEGGCLRPPTTTALITSAALIPMRGTAHCHYFLPDWEGHAALNPHPLLPLTPHLTGPPHIQ